MIVVQLMGGLGNQMFQYAFAKSLSVKLATNMVLDKRLLLKENLPASVTPREFELNIFDLKEEIIVSEPKFGLSKTLPYRLNKWLDPLVKKYGKDLFFGDTSKVEELFKRNYRSIFLKGYFQKEAFFKEHENLVRKAFVFRKELSAQNKTISESIRAVNSVSMHIRRGDYIGNNPSGSYHGLCTPHYYAEAISHFKNTVIEPHFFVFSDDMAWSREFLKHETRITFIDHNRGETNYVDMQLMSYCKHNIIANSSFSWWGAWLNENPDKTVIAPKKWYTDDTIDTSGLFPEKWITR